MHILCITCLIWMCFKPPHFGVFCTIFSCNLLCPLQRKSLHSFCKAFSLSVLIVTVLSAWVATDKIKLLRTATLARSVKCCFFHLEATFLNFTRMCSKFKVSVPRYTPRYFTGSFVTLIPLTVVGSFIEWENTIVFCKFRVKPVYCPHSCISVITIPSWVKSHKIIATSSTYKLAGFPTRAYQRKIPLEARKYIVIWLTKLKRWQYSYLTHKIEEMTWQQTPLSNSSAQRETGGELPMISNSRLCLGI